MTEDWRAQGRARRTHVKLGALGLLATGILSVGSCLKPIARDLTERTHQALSQAGFPDLEVSFKGREGTISGVVGSQADLDRVRYFAESQRGVRWVDVSGVSFNGEPGAPKSTAPATQPQTPAHVGFQVLNGRLILSGVVPTQADKDRAAKAAAAFGGEVENQIRVEPATQPKWLPTAWDPLPALKGLESPSMRIAGQRTTVSGHAPSLEARKAVLDAVARAHAGQTVDDRMTVVVPAKTALTLAAAGQRATLTGVVPTQDAKDEAGAAAAALFGAGNVDNQLKVESGADSPKWLGQLWGAFEALKPVRLPGVKAADGTLILEGQVETERVKQRVGKAVTAASPNLTVDNQIQVIKAVDQAKQSLTELMREVQGKGIYFDSGSADIKPAGAAHLDKVADLLNALRKVNVLVAGHTDSQGSEPSNRTLSQKRANAVKRYLVGKGVDARRLRAKGYGERKPVATNKTEEGRALNRRIEFIARGR